MFIGFLPNVVLKSAILRPLSAPNFSPIGARIRVLWRILQSVRKEVEGKNEEKINEILVVRISEITWAIFFKVCM